MSFLLRSTRSSLGGRDFALRNSLVAKLSSCVKDLQVEQADPDSIAESSSEAISALCTILEAIFIHGLKETFIQKVSQAVMSEFDARPEPNFWTPLLEISHRDVIDEVMKLSLIQTDIGRCRAWLRLALNEGVLSRYLEAMRTEGQRTLSHYYRKGALVRDVEMLDVVQRLLEGIEAFPFNLPLNTSLLDKWTLQPLLQAGLWTPPIKSTVAKDPIAVATDIAQILEKEEQGAMSADTVSVASFASHHSLGFSPMMALNEEEALKIILGTPVNETPISARLKQEEDEMKSKDSDKPSCEPERHESQTEGESKNQVELSTSQIEKDPEERKKEETEEDDNNSAMGNSLIGRLGWSSSFEESMDDTENKREENCVREKQKRHRKTKISFQSYHSLIESYNTASSSGLNPPDLTDFLQQFEPSNSASPSGSISEQTDLSYPQDLGFEIIDRCPSSHYMSEFGSLLLQVSKLPRELGLDAQKYTCFSCGEPVGFNFGEVKLCGLSGRYFCKECSVNPGEEWVVPARILFNWDYQRYNVSKRAATFLSEIQHHPLLDLKTLNPLLYLAVREVSELQILRNQLNLLRAYLFTCREPVIEELQKMVWPRDYLYEHVHLYSISDLLQIPNGALAQQLKQVVSFAQNHVYNCWLCSQKGFICEVCNDLKIIYPFDTSKTYRCPGCNAVFHAECLNKKRPCPKCERRKKRSEAEPSDGVQEAQ